MMLYALAVISLAVAPQQSSPWSYVERVDKMNDDKSYMAQAATENGSIIVGCRVPGAHSVHVAVITTAFLGNSDHSIFYRFDDQKQDQLYAFDSDTLARSFDDKQVTKFLAAMKSATLLRVRVVTFRGDLIDLEFPVAGASEVIAKAGVACGDKRFSGS